jgi:hypothetical protein
MLDGFVNHIRRRRSVGVGWELAHENEITQNAKGLKRYMSSIFYYV